MPVLFHVSDSLEGHRHCTYILSPQSELLMVKLLLAQTSEGLVLRIQGSIAQLCIPCHLVKKLVLWVHLTEGPTEDGAGGGGQGG